MIISNIYLVSEAVAEIFDIERNINNYIAEYTQNVLGNTVYSYINSLLELNNEKKRICINIYL